MRPQQIRDADGVCRSYASPLDVRLAPETERDPVARLRAYARQVGIDVRTNRFPDVQGTTLRAILEAAQRQGFDGSYQLLHGRDGRWVLSFAKVHPADHPTGNGGGPSLEEICEEDRDRPVSAETDPRRKRLLEFCSALR